MGYRIRLDSKVGPNTRIEVVTEGILARRLQDDPALEGVGLVIFDEFHERSLDADLALALTLNGRAMFRAQDTGEAPLKVLLMSATLEGERLASLLGDAPAQSSRAIISFTCPDNASSLCGSRKSAVPVLLCETAAAASLRFRRFAPRPAAAPSPCARHAL